MQIDLLQLWQSSFTLFLMEHTKAPAAKKRPPSRRQPCEADEEVATLPLPPLQLVLDAWRQGGDVDQVKTQWRLRREAKSFQPGCTAHQIAAATAVNLYRTN